VNPWREYVSVAPGGQRGVWHALWEAALGRRFVSKKSIRFRIRELFALCPEIVVEFERSYGMPSHLLNLVKPDVCADQAGTNVWLTLSVTRGDLKRNNISVSAFVDLISHYGKAYRQVQGSPNEQALAKFESVRPRHVKPKEGAHQTLARELRALNLFTSFDAGNPEFFIPVERKLPRRLPQLVVLYTLAFWLGSIVRYDPHSVSALEQSRFWVLIDGFMNQSRVWLLELFEWYLYRTQIVLRSAR
jgi:hypothetical protein